MCPMYYGAAIPSAEIVSWRFSGRSSDSQLKNLRSHFSFLARGATCFLCGWSIRLRASMVIGRIKFDPASNGENQQIGSPRVNLATGIQAGNSNLRRNHSSCPLLSRYNGVDGGGRVDRHHFSLHKSLDCFIHITSKFPLVILLLLIVFCVIPGSAIILVLYLLLTVVFAIPSVLVLYFAYPTLERLVREITSWGTSDPLLQRIWKYVAPPGMSFIYISSNSSQLYSEAPPDDLICMEDWKFQ